MYFDTGTSDIYTSRWFAYESFRFLEDRDKPRDRINTVRRILHYIILYFNITLLKIKYLYS